VPLRREVRFEDLVADIRVHTMPIVRDRNLHVLSPGHARMLTRVGVVQHDFLDFDRELAAVRHCITGIDCKIRHDLIEVTRIDEDVSTDSEARLQADSRSEQTDDYRSHPFDTLCKPQNLGMTEISLRDVPKPPRELPCASNDTLNRPNVVPDQLSGAR